MQDDGGFVSSRDRHRQLKHWLITLSLLAILGGKPVHTLAHETSSLAREPSRRYVKKLIPNDPLFSRQWHLQPAPSAGVFSDTVRVRVADVWERYRGKGVVIAVVDDGVEVGHPDLAENCDPALGFDYRDNDFDAGPATPDDTHGTQMAGIMAARGNNREGIAGVAFEATLASVRLIGGDLQTDEMNARALLHSNVVVHISSNGWGPIDDGERLEAPGPQTRSAFVEAARSGRGGRGTIFVWPAGNGALFGDNANYDGFANSPYAIAVGAVDEWGIRAPYSEEGACVMVVAPGGLDSASNGARIVTTDRTGEGGSNFGGASGDVTDNHYTEAAYGTSVAAATVSGVIALVLEANPSLGWRDVQEILIRSAVRNDAADSDWLTNSAGFHFNHKYGAGLVNAAAAVDLASRWVNLAPRTNVVVSHPKLAIPIPNNDAQGVAIDFNFGDQPAVRVEHALVSVSIKHPRRGDLAITLISPSGTKSRLAEKHRDANANYPDWTFSSVFHWGEESRGKWQVHVADRATPNWGTIEAMSIELLGTRLDEAAGAGRLSGVTLAPGQRVNGRFELLISGQPGSRYVIEASDDLVTWKALTPASVLTGTSARFVDPSAVDARARLYRAMVLPVEQ